MKKVLLSILILVCVMGTAFAQQPNPDDKVAIVNLENNSVIYATVWKNILAVYQEAYAFEMMQIAEKKGTVYLMVHKKDIWNNVIKLSAVWYYKVNPIKRVPFTMPYSTVYNRPLEMYKWISAFALPGLILLFGVFFSVKFIRRRIKLK